MLSSLLKYHGVKNSIEEFLQTKNYDKLNEIICSLRIDEVGVVIQKLSKEHLMQIVNIFPKLLQYEYFITFTKNLKNNLIELISSENLQKIFANLTHDDLFIIVANVSNQNRNKIMNIISVNEQGAINLKEKYGSYDVGEIISLNYIIMPLYWSVKKAKDFISSDKRFYKNNYKILIVNEKLEIVGFVLQSALLVAKENLLINDIFNFGEFSVNIEKANIPKLLSFVSDNRLDFIVILDLQNKLIGTVSSTDILIKSQKGLLKNVEKISEDTTLLKHSSKYFIESFIPFFCASLIYLLSLFLQKDNNIGRVLLPFLVIIPISFSYVVFRCIRNIKNISKASIKPVCGILMNFSALSVITSSLVGLLSSLNIGGVLFVSNLLASVFSIGIVFALFQLIKKRENLVCLFSWKYISTLLLFCNLLFVVLICFFY